MRFDLRILLIFFLLSISNISSQTLIPDPPEVNAKSYILVEAHTSEIISEQNFLLDEVDELYLFSKCKHAIISNSTFSWWGAWLTDIEKKIIISPEINITGPYMAWGFYGLIPEHWIKLSVISLI